MFGLEEECIKAAKTLRSFRMPQNEKGVDKFIPEDIIARAKGLVIMTVVKAGFLFSGRVGLGLVVAKLPNGEWSAPSAIGTGSFGAGLQIGAEVTDFVIILNNRRAVEAFSVGGNVALGGNLSVAAGPTGRNAEASAMGTIAAVFSYSKTKGLFAGISIEGTVFVERTDANEKMYGRRLHARQLLSGEVPAPPEAYSLYEALKLRTAAAYPNAAAVEGETDNWENPLTPQQQQQAAAVTTPYPPSSTSSYTPPPSSSSPYYPATAPQPLYPSAATPSFNAPTQQAYPTNPLYPPPNYSPTSTPPPVKPRTSSANPALKEKLAAFENPNAQQQQQFAVRPLPAVPPSSRSSHREKEEVKTYPKARVLYDFSPLEPGDMELKKGQVIEVIEKTDSSNGWWMGKNAASGVQGNFPGNFVELLN